MRDESVVPDLSAPSSGDASSYGILVTVVSAVLLALGYYGVVAIDQSRALGEAIPEPFYFLALAVLFALELLRAGSVTIASLGRAIAFTAVFGGLFVLAVEGGALLWERPELALEGYAGVTVLAAAIVIASLSYVAVLAAVSERQ